MESATDQCGQAGFVAGRIKKIAEHDGESGGAGFDGTATERFVQLSATGGGERRDVLEELHGGFAATHRTERALDGGLLIVAGGSVVFRRRGLDSALRIRKRNHAHAIKAAQRHVADGGGDLAGEIEFARLAESHGLAGIEKNAHGQFALLLVELEEKFFEAAEEIPIEVAEIVAGDVTAVVRELDGLPAGAAAALAFGTALGAPRGEQLELLKAAQEFGGEEGHGHPFSSSQRLITHL